MMQQVQLVHDAVACREAPLDGKKNSISRSAEAGESDAWTEYQRTKHDRYFNKVSITFQMPIFLLELSELHLAYLNQIWHVGWVALHFWPWQNLLVPQGPATG